MEQYVDWLTYAISIGSFMAAALPTKKMGKLGGLISKVALNVYNAKPQEIVTEYNSIVHGTNSQEGSKGDGTL
jgi:hypothetical protein